jgi:hypothetical protein
MRTHPQSIEVVLRVLKKICEAAESTTAERFRACELILAAYNRLVFEPERKPQHRALKTIVDARLELSAVDKEIAGRVRAEQAKQRKERKLQREIEKLLSKTQEPK